MGQRTAKIDPVESARDEERRRIASELHDRVLQALANVALRLEAMRKRVLQTEAETRNDLAIAEEDIRFSMREIRGVLAAGHKRSWDAGSLIEKLRDVSQSMARSAGIEISFETHPDELAIHDADLEYHVFQATAEALRNVVRHANAREATLTVALTGDKLLVSLSDNGQGFDATADGTDRCGLSSMRSRIEGMGGSMTIRSGPDQGTTVSFSVPVAGPSGC